MKTSKDNSEYGSFIDLVDAAVRTPHDEIKAELEDEKRRKKANKRVKKQPASGRASDAMD